MAIDNSGEARQLDDGGWEITHADGRVETMTEGQFKASYQVDTDTEQAGVDWKTDDEGVKQPANPHAIDDDGLVSRAAANRPTTTETDLEGFEPEQDWTGTYIGEVEAELKSYKDGIKAVEAELKSAKSVSKSGEPQDFASLRAAMHELSHGNSLLRTAHPPTTRHDQPETLRPGPNEFDNVSSGGEGEFTNPEASRQWGR